MDIFSNQLIQFYSNNATNLHHVTTHSTTCCPTKWKSWCIVVKAILAMLHWHLLGAPFTQACTIGLPSSTLCNHCTNNKEVIQQAGWFLRPDCAPGPNAPSSECPPNVVPNCEFRTCRDPKFLNAIHSEFMNTPNVEFLNVPLCSAPMSYLASSKWGRPLCYGHNAARWCLQHGRGCRVCTCVMAIGADFKLYLLRHFCSNRIIFFSIHRRHRRKKWWTRILKIEFCDFWEFFEIFKKASHGPSVADLEHYGRGQTTKSVNVEG